MVSLSDRSDEKKGNFAALLFEFIDEFDSIALIIYMTVFADQEFCLALYL